MVHFLVTPTTSSIYIFHIFCLPYMYCEKIQISLGSLCSAYTYSELQINPFISVFELPFSYAKMELLITVDNANGVLYPFPTVRFLALFFPRSRSDHFLFTTYLLYPAS